MNPPDLPQPADGAATYTPGYVAYKRAMLIGGLVLAAFGAFEVWTPLRLTLFGARAQAEAVRVVKEKSGLPPVIMTDDTQVQSHRESRDRSYVFWNEFQFHTEQGRLIGIRANVGSQLKPLYPLTDADGLPTTDVVFYDPARPEDAIFPFIISTWLAPLVLLLLGLSCAIIGAVLLHWANQPIEIPHLQPGGISPPDAKK